MRKLAIHVLFLVLSILVWSPAARAAPPPADIPDPSEFRLYFLHLANLDAAADKADAEGTAGDTATWRSFEQKMAGLTESEGALLKDVAYRCNQTLDEDLEGSEPMEIVREAVDELETVLGPSAFEAVAGRIRGFLRPGITRMPAAVEEVEEGLEPTDGSVQEEDELPVEPLALGPSVNVVALTYKIQDGTFMAECITSPNDAETIQRYAGGVVHSCLVNGGGLTAPISVPCGPGNGCIANLPPALPGRSRSTQGTHGLRMKYSATCLGQPFDGLEDPMHYCRNGSLPPHYFETGDVPPLGGTPTCWDPQVSCVIATSVSSQVVYLDIVPRDSTIHAGGQKQFRGILDMLTTWSTNGPGTIDEVTGLYKAPATVIGEQTATIKGCDAYHPGDCTTTTIKVVPLNVSVSPASVAELLPSDDQSFTATVTPSGTGLTVEWSLIDPSNAAFISTTSGSAAAVLKAPANDRISGDQVTITVKACVRPAPESEQVCGTAQVTVPQMLFYIDGSKKTLAPGETVQLTAFVFGSSVTRKVNWTTPTAGTLTPAIPGETMDDTFVVVYKAPTFTEGSGVVVKACLKESPDFCATYPISFRADPTITAVTSDSGKWNAGTLTSFTITGTGFGSNPVVKFTSLQPTVTLASDTRIEGQVRLPIAMGGKTTVPSVLVTYPNGDTAEGFSSSKTIAPAVLSVQPATVELHGGESRLFSFICLQASGELCTTVEPPAWTASPGAIDASGRYTAPASVPSNTTATVKACWSIDICATAQVTLLAPAGPVVVVSPKTVSLMPGQTQPFTAPVTGTPNTAVTWSIQPPVIGSITQAGVYTAPSPFAGPATVTIVATSQADATRNDTAVVTLIPAVLSVTSTPSPPSANHGTVITWTATASGGTPGTIQYALFRRKAGTTAWNPEVWQASNVLTWTPGAADVATWEIRIGAKDVNTAPGAHALHDPGSVQVRAPLTFVCPTSTPFANHGTAFTWTVNASGGTGTGRQYALFRRRAGTTPWTPDVTAPAWQPGNILSWTPAAADVGHWEIYIWVKDSGTPPTQNTHGYAAGCNPGPIQVLRPITLTSTPSPASAYYGLPITWTATATGADPATVQFSWGRRRVGTADWIPAVQVWQGNTFNWTPTSADTGAWEIAVVVKDGSTPPTLNTHGYAAYYNPGQVNVVTPLTLTGTMSPASVNHGTAITWTATASGGTSVNRQYALFRRRAGTTPWTPDVTTPAWQTSNVLSWTPAAADVGAWEIFIWVKDSATPPTMNTYGHAAWYNAGTVNVQAPVTFTTTPSPALVNHGTTITWTATATGGTGVGRQYALLRKKTGTTTWIPLQTSPAWQTSNVLSWTPSSADLGTWEISIWFKDSGTSPTMNTYGYAASYNPGSVQVLAPPTINCPISPPYANPGTPITWTVTASGGNPATIQYALFRRRAGTTPWTPALTAPAWQSGNVLSWTPAAADLGSWEIQIWIRDGNTPPTQNTYGYAASCSPGTVQVVASPTLVTTPSPASAYSGQAIAWTATANGGVPASTQFALFRRKVGTTSWIPAVTTPAWQASNVLSWTPASTDLGAWEISIWVRDGNTPPTMNGNGYAASYNPGQVNVVTPLTLAGTTSPASATYGNQLTWTATASGGTGVGRQYAFFRKRPSDTVWTPNVTTPAWQTGNVLSWTPAAGDVGTWDTYIWVKDSATPPTMNTYGHAAWYNSGTVQIVGPLGLTSTASPALATHGNTISWTATATGGVPASTQFALRRRVTGTSAWTPASPAWQASNALSWTPTPGEVATWEIAIWVRDGNTPPTMNGSGYAATYNPGSVRVVAPLTVTGNGSPGSAYYGNPITWTATGSGGTGVGRQYAFFRKRSEATTWIPVVTSPAWQTSNVMSWTPGSADAGSWDTSIWFRDANTPANANGYGYGAYYMPGSVQVLAPPTVTGTGSPASVNYGTTITWTATASGGTGSAKQYAFFRKKVGTSNWIPAITSPAWQTSNVMSWTPASSDTGTWETSIWLKDADTPPTMNGYGYASYYNPGPVQVTGPLTLSCSGSPTSATSGTTLTWTANAGGGHSPTIQYAFFRRRSGTGNSGWIPSIYSPAWQSSNVMTWTPTSGDVGPWDVYTWVRDGNTPANMNTYGYAVGCNSGSVQVTAPLGLSGTGSPSSAEQGTEITWIAYASGGYPPTTQYALFRRPSGSGNSGWIPSIYSPAWQSSNVMSWTPTSSDVGTWDIYIWVKDGNTPASMNTYGYAAGYNAGSVEVIAPVYQSYEPTGYVDGYDRQHIWGWACDPDYPWESNRVDIWSTSWQYLGSADAYYWSSSPINSACGGGSAHYFDFYHNGSIPPGTHFWVWSIDLPYATPNGVNVPIGGNGGIAGGNEFVMP